MAARQMFTRMLRPIVFSNVRVDIATPNSKKRTSNRKIDIFDSPGCDFAHRAQSGDAGPAKQVHQESFHEIVGMMGEKNGAAASAFRHLRKKSVARFAGRGFER